MLKFAGRLCHAVLESIRGLDALVLEDPSES